MRPIAPLCAALTASVLALSTIGAATALAAPVSATQTAELNEANGSQGDLFGSSAAISGSTIVVGASAAGGNNEGLVDVYNSAGTETGQLRASNGQQGDGFGSSVAISGSTIVVGAPDVNGGDGAVYIFTTSGQEVTEIQAPAGSNDSLGSSVAISGSTIVAGAPGVNGGDGGIFVYNAAGVQTASAVGPAGQGDTVGQSVAISGSTIVAGAPLANNDDGQAFVYTTAGQRSAVISGLSGSGDELGSSVAISGSTLVLGADEYNNGQGEALVDTVSGQQTAALVAPDAAVGDDFGVSVGISGSDIAVGAEQHNNGQGAGYLFTTAGTPLSELTASDGAAGDNLGTALAVDGSTVVAGAPQRNNGQGSAYVYADTLTVGESGSGTVSSSDGQITCPGTCSAGYLPGASVTLTATRAGGSTFAGFTGGGCAGTGPCTVTVNGATAVSAVFAAETGPPIASIGSPVSGGTYALGANVATSFSCVKSVTGPAVAACTDSNGAAASGQSETGAGALNTATAGQHTYTVTATATDGETSSAQISYTVIGPPVSSAPPVITGTPTVGSTLTCSGGAWSGATVNVTDAWAADGTPIPSAAAATYTVPSSEAGDSITCIQTATNIAGSAAATSAPVLIAEPGATAPPTATKTRFGLTGGSVVSDSQLRYVCEVHATRPRTAARLRGRADSARGRHGRRDAARSGAGELSRCTVRVDVGTRTFAAGTAHGNRASLAVTVALDHAATQLLVARAGGVRVSVHAIGTLRGRGVRRATTHALLSLGHSELIPTAGMFEPNSPALTPYGASFLRYTAAHISHADEVVCLGYTAAPGDWLTNTPFSLQLAAERAQLACRTLRRHHVSAVYGTEALGKKDPLVPNITTADLARNRRVEFDVYSKLTLRRS